MFVPNTPNVANNYGNAVKAAVEAFAADIDLVHYVVTCEDFKRPEDAAPYAATSAANGLNKLLNAMRSTHKAIVGKDDGVACVAIERDGANNA